MQWWELFSSNDDENNNDKSKKIDGFVCVVTGGSRGIGKGICIELGKAGAIVYITGTSSSQQKDDTSGSSSPFAASSSGANDDPGTIEETAQAVTDAGGLGIPFYCDHSQDDQVEALFEKVKSDYGRLDLLVNNCFRIPPGGTTELMKKFWNLTIDSWDYIHTIGLRSHFVATKLAVPIMMQNPPRLQSSTMAQPLIVMISSFGALTYTFNVPYGVGKAGVDRMVKDMAIELQSTPQTSNINIVSLWPGVVLTERTKVAVENGSWDRDVGIPLDNAESPFLTGRVVVDLVLSPPRTSGSFQVVAEVAQERGIFDITGQQPPSIRSLKFLLKTYGIQDEELRKKIPDWLIPDWKLPFWVMAGGAPPDRS